MAAAASWRKPTELASPAAPGADVTDNASVTTPQRHQPSSFLLTSTPVSSGGSSSSEQNVGDQRGQAAYRTGRSRLQLHRSAVNEKIHRELQMTKGAENMLKVTKDKQAKTRISVELKFAYSNLELLQRELADINEALEVYQDTHWRLPMVPLGLKETRRINFEPALADFIEEHYSADRKDFQQSFKELNELREAARRPERSDSGLAAQFVYLNQLWYLDRRFFPPWRQQPIFFEWFDSFTGVPFMQRSVAFEKACVAFNIAALQSQMSVSAGVSSDALRRLRLAWGGVQFVSENFTHAPSMDMKPAVLAMVANLLAAQAYEMQFQLGAEAKPLSTSVQHLAEWHLQRAQHAEFVSEVFNNVDTKLSGDILRYSDFIPDTWLTLVQLKTNYFKGLARLSVANFIIDAFQANATDSSQLMLVAQIMQLLSDTLLASHSRKPNNANELRAFARLYAAESMSCFEEAIRLMSLNRKLSDLEVCSSTLNRLHSRARSLHLDIELAASEQLVTFYSSGIRGRAALPLSPLEPNPYSHPVQDLFSSLGPISFFNCRNSWSQPREICLSRAAPPIGFGFSLSGEAPVVVASVDADSPAEAGGVAPRDVVIGVGQEDVKWASHEHLSRLIRDCNSTLRLWLVSPIEISRPAVSEPNASISGSSGLGLQHQQQQQKGSWRKRLSGSWLFRRRKSRAGAKPPHRHAQSLQSTM